MPRSKIDSWLMQQAGKPADPDEPANLTGSSDAHAMIAYEAADGSTQYAFRHFWAAMKALMPSQPPEEDGIMPVTDISFDYTEIPASVLPGDGSDHKMTRAIRVFGRGFITKLGYVLYYRGPDNIPFYLVWQTP